MKPIRIFNRTLHREMWNWLADHPEAIKDDWPGLERLSPEALEQLDDHSLCFACLASSETQRAHCNSCPLDWGERQSCCDGFVDIDYAGLGVFHKWESAMSPDVASHYAKEIADMPLKSDNEFVTIVI